MTLVLTWLVSTISLAARKRTVACSNTLSQGLQKIQAAREYDFAPVLALSPIWDKEFLAPSMARSTADAFHIVRCLDHTCKLDDAPQDKRRKVATALLRDKLLAHDFAGPFSLRASRILGTISRFRVAEILPHMKLASRASRPGLTVGFLRILCNGLCMAQRFHTEGEEQMCRIDARTNPTLSLSRTTMFVPCCTICLPLFGRMLRHYQGGVIFFMT